MRAAVVRVGAAVGERGMCRGKVGEWLGCVDDVRAACVCICVCTNLPHLITPSLTSLAPMHPALQLPPHAQCHRCRPLPPRPTFPFPAATAAATLPAFCLSNASSTDKGAGAPGDTDVSGKLPSAPASAPRPSPPSPAMSNSRIVISCSLASASSEARCGEENRRIGWGGRCTVVTHAQPSPHSHPSPSSTLDHSCTATFPLISSLSPRMPLPCPSAASPPPRSPPAPSETPARRQETPRRGPGGGRGVKYY